MSLGYVCMDDEASGGHHRLRWTMTVSYGCVSRTARYGHFAFSQSLAGYLGRVAAYVAVLPLLQGLQESLNVPIAGAYWNPCASELELAVGFEPSGGCLCERPARSTRRPQWRWIQFVFGKKETKDEVS